MIQLVTTHIDHNLNFPPNVIQRYLGWDFSIWLEWWYCWKTAYHWAVSIERLIRGCISLAFRRYHRRCHAVVRVFAPLSPRSGGHSGHVVGMVGLVHCPAVVVGVVRTGVQVRQHHVVLTIWWSLHLNLTPVNWNQSKIINTSYQNLIIRGWRAKLSLHCCRPGFLPNARQCNTRLCPEDFELGNLLQPVWSNMLAILFKFQGFFCQTFDPVCLRL